ncbi:MAG: NAD(P)/FAD-dependent oxidoreductase [Arthrobacter sp.]|uniref:FAD-dependent oxidoreductase n=1 Tax=Arthrobacter sp. TaxID=1667 RepID=UPI00346C0A2A
MIDVAIAGGGPAGLCLAILLAQAGAEVRVLERRATAAEGSRAIGLHPPGLDVLDAAGVGRAAVAAGVRIRDGRAVARNRTVAGLDFGVLGGAHPYVLALPQAVTVRLLEDRLAEVAPGALRRGVRVLGAAGTPRGDGVAVRLGGNGGGAEPPAGVLPARYLVGADGTRSAVRDAGGFAASGREYPDRYLMGDFADDSGLGPTAVLFLHERGIVECFPLPGAVRRWVVRLGRRDDPGSPGGAGEGARTDPSWLAEEIRRRTGRRVDPAGNTMLSWFATRRRTVETMAAGRTVLIGDAAHEVSPIGGQGMTLGLADAAELAGLLLADRTPTAGELAAFSRRRLAAARSAGRQAHVNMALGRPLPGPLLHGRNALIRQALRSRPLADGVARRFAMRA